MSMPITVTIPHNLGKAEARRRLEEGLNSNQQGLSGGMMGLLAIRPRWEGDRLHFEGGTLGQRMTGVIEVMDEAVRIQIDLPALLAAFADRMKGTLQEQTRRLLERK